MLLIDAKFEKLLGEWDTLEYVQNFALRGKDQLVLVKSNPIAKITSLKHGSVLAVASRLGVV